MVREEKIEKIIKQAVDSCGSSLKDVRYFLVKALEELKKIKTKKTKQESVFQNWKLDVNTSSLINLNSSQRKNILGNIEKMISNEESKLTRSKIEDIEKIIDLND